MAYGWYNGLQKHIKSQHAGLIKMPTEKSFYKKFEQEEQIKMEITGDLTVEIL